MNILGQVMQMILLKWVPTLRDHVCKLEEYTIERYFEYYFGISTSLIDLFEDLESCDANEFHRVGIEFKTNVSNGTKSVQVTQIKSMKALWY